MTRVYPGSFGGFPRCEVCFRRKPDLATTCDRRVSPDGAAMGVCGDCFHAIAACQPIDVPTGDELAETWESLAHLYANGEIDAKVIDRAQDRLAPHLAFVDACAAFQDLVDALVYRQQVADGDVTVNEVDSHLANQDALADRAQSGVDDAIRSLCPRREPQELAS